MGEGAQNLQDQILQSVRDFVGDSLGGTKGQLQNARTQLEEFAGQVSQEEAQAEVQEMVDSLYEIESKIDQAAQDQGLGDAIDEAAQQGQDTQQGGGQEGGAGEEPNATQAAAQRAQELSVDLSQIEGTGSEGRITVKDVVSAAGGAAGQPAQQAQDAADQATQQGGGQEQLNATQAAAQKAQELGVDLSQVEGTGSEGRITVKDVTGAANQG